MFSRSGLIAKALSFLSLASGLMIASSSPAQAVAVGLPVLRCAAVSRPVGTNGNPTTSLIIPDPAYSGTFDFDGVFASQVSFTMTVPGSATNRSGAGSKAGWNFPAFKTGQLPAGSGDCALVESFYSVTGLSAPAADPGIRIVVQTSDGLYHTSTKTLTSIHIPNGVVTNVNGRTAWQFVPFGIANSGPNNFTPPLVSGAGAEVRKIAVGFFGNSGTNSMNEIIPPTYVTGGGYYLLSGSAGFIINDPTFTSSGGLPNLCTFTTNVNPDTQFNFEFP